MRCPTASLFTLLLSKTDRICTSSNLVVDVAIKQAASVALDQPTGDCHADRPYGGAQIDFRLARSR
jgi:hypothetical protein